MAEGKDEINKNIILFGVKNNFILKKIFDNLKHNILLNIIRYNKGLQNKLNKDINDYKDLLSIEIDIIPVREKIGNSKFIHIDEKESYTSFYRFYLNDNKEETKKNYIEEKDKVTKIKVIIDYQKKSLKEQFKECEFIKEIYFIKCNNKNIIDMSYMFSGCRFLQKIDFSNFNTNNVIDMSGMFNRCHRLYNVNFSKLNTNKVTNMSHMFHGCSYFLLKELNLSNFNINNVTNMSHMFEECTFLEVLNLSSFNTSNVSDMSYMFSNCDALEKLNLSSFNTEKVTDMSNMFYCSYKIK